ncbi:hypothetical protein ACFOTA_08270 [Chitinophaga sp. GCM10012297]|uniref:Uncharacterized protein n=1 Tax=Chitinophaga chungangae TaxID=2821488 RepID=A0ABS3YD14_9BACT|nr:hypothetical protein [Chitinophaga chungangae]MBO9152198.1 hypothetical protein [Chitinophaga chungangae]
MKSHVFKVMIAGAFAALLLMNFEKLSARTQSKNETGAALLNSDTGDSDSNTDTNGGGAYKYCATDECTRTILIGEPPYEIPVVEIGYYKHCVLTPDATQYCNSSLCDVVCTFDDDTL